VIFTELTLQGAYAIDPEMIEDERGSFGRVFCSEEFGRLGLDIAFAQCSVSFNRKKGTLRGMHYQAEPDAEAKLVRCTMGTIFDVLVDIRPDSPAFGRWAGVELSADNRRMVYVPRGFAHGFETLTDDAEIFYQISAPFRPAASRGFRWDDPAVGIKWPQATPSVISARDRELPRLVA
jgi:dTDP-4-dehydrorhamnose 3,5-epimerase